jgi:hypothetical protein
MYQRTELFINDEWTAPGSGTVDVVSPHTEQVIAQAPAASSADVDRVVGGRGAGARGIVRRQRGIHHGPARPLLRTQGQRVGT